MGKKSSVATPDTIGNNKNNKANSGEKSILKNIVNLNQISIINTIVIKFKKKTEGDFIKNNTNIPTVPTINVVVSPSGLFPSLDTSNINCSSVDVSPHDTK